MKSASLSSVSFRDPAGFLFSKDGILYRQINQVYRHDFDQLIDSGLYEELIADGFLVAHQAVDVEGPSPDPAYKVICPSRIEFISYPNEWCFSQLRDAACLTLAIQRKSIERGMSLKDASAFNVQFERGRPLFIDTLSFECYREGEPWVAYRQFCQHFLAPLALMSFVDTRLNQLWRASMEGISLDLAARMLPLSSRFRPGLAMHLHLHARMNRSIHRRARSSTQEKPGRPDRRFGRSAMLSLIDHLDATIRGLALPRASRGWLGYYQDHSYSSESFDTKAQLVADIIEQVRPGRVCDLGANTGRFSRLASDRSIPTLSCDLEIDCVEDSYQQAIREGETSLLPLVLDLLNPSSATGWRNLERQSFLERCQPDLVLALALVHHLVFAGNLPLVEIADFFEQLTPRLLIEFVPADDSQVLRLQSAVRGIHHRYDREHFEACFARGFELESQSPIHDSGRSLYLYRRRNAPC
jgi:hypothetical protein